MGRSWCCDVVIVGGGAVGGMLALGLDKLGYSVTLLERQQLSFSSTSPERVIALNEGSRRHLASLGIWPEIAAQGLGLIRKIMVSEAGHHGRAYLNVDDLHDQNAEGLGYVVEMGVLLQPLYAALQASSVKLVTGMVLQQYHTDPQQVTLQLQCDSGEVKTVHASLLVGADGTQSQVRRMAGIGVRGWDYNRFGIVASVTTDGGHHDTAHECFRGSGPLAFLPMADGRFSIVWVAAPAEAMQLLSSSDQQCIANLQRAIGQENLQQIGAIQAISKRVSYPLALSIATSFTAPRIALVGNAAHTVHPVAGQGMNLGFRDVMVLLDTLDSALARRDPGQSVLLQGYAEKRRLDVLAVSAFTESMSSLFANDMPGIKGLRGIGLSRLSQLPILQDMLLQHAAGVAQLPKIAAGGMS